VEVERSAVYDAEPVYSMLTGTVTRGWEAAVKGLPAGDLVLGVDGPAVLNWDLLLDGLVRCLDTVGRRPTVVDMRTLVLPWPKVVALTSTVELEADPHFARLPEVALRAIFGPLPPVGLPAGAASSAVGTAGARTTLVFGPGAALLSPTVLWYADLPKRFAEAGIVAGTARNLGQPPDTGPGTTRRLFYLDWPILDRHREDIAARVDRWIDVQDDRSPRSVDGGDLRRTLATLATRPFRTRPTFNTTSWGGHWAQHQLGVNPDAPNTALGYELIAPESGILLGDDIDRVEIAFQVLVGAHPELLLGEPVYRTFGTSFPVRFDYLDTVGGANLSVHCHPRPEYMREIFGWPYTQHETYYVMVGSPNHKIFLGLRDDIDVDKFHRQAQEAHDRDRAFDIEDHVQTFPADPHQLFLVPAGTPHGSGKGNVVLEVSATPYLYSLRFYDWLRRTGIGGPRAVHVERAFANLTTDRVGRAVAADLVQSPRTVRSGPGWREEQIGSLPEMFFDVHRVVLTGTADHPASHAPAPGQPAGDDSSGGGETDDASVEAPDDTGGSFVILSVVDGAGVELVTATGSHFLVYAETLVVPAAVGPYRLRRLGDAPVRVVKAFVR